MPPTAIVAIIAIALAILPSTVAYAEATDRTDMEISGRYADPASGAEIDLPAGWTGVDYFGSALISPDGIGNVMTEWPEVSMMVIVTERSDLAERIAAAKDSQASADECSTLSTTYMKVDDMNAMELVKECDVDGYTKSKIYMLPTDTMAAILAFTASSQEQYDSHLAAFEQSAQTLQLGTSTVDVRSFVAISLGLQTSSHPITIAGKQVDFAVDSSSQISGLGFDEAGKQISFTVEGKDSTRGTTIIPISWVLEGPYVVSIDGEATDDYDIIRDGTTGETRIRLDYSHSVHEISISGAAVVPEFPVTTMGAVAAVIGAVALLSRIRVGRTLP